MIILLYFDFNKKFKAFKNIFNYYILIKNFVNIKF